MYGNVGSSESAIGMRPILLLLGERLQLRRLFLKIRSDREGISD
jgi:hypothetical protein